MRENWVNGAEAEAVGGGWKYGGLRMGSTFTAALLWPPPPPPPPPQPPPPPPRKTQ